MSAVSTVVLQITIDPLWFVVGAVGLFLLAAVVGPQLLLSLRETRPPSADERRLLDSLLAPADSEPAAISVVETVGEHSIETALRGLPGRRTLVITDYVLSELAEETATALLAAEVERARHGYLEYRAVAAATVIGIATAMFGGLFSFSDGLFALAVAAFVLFWVGRQLQFRADRAAADRVGGESLAAAFETVAELRGIEPETATWQTWFEVQPPLGQRIDRLRSQS